MPDDTVNERQKKAIEEFARAMVGCQSMLWVAIVKPPGGVAMYRTGGYKESGPTFVDIAKSIGALAGDIAKVLRDAMVRQGNEITFEEALQGVMQHMVAGATNMTLAGGKSTMMEEGGGQPSSGPGSAPRGF